MLREKIRGTASGFFVHVPEVYNLIISSPVGLVDAHNTYTSLPIIVAIAIEEDVGSCPSGPCGITATLVVMSLM